MTDQAESQTPQGADVKTRQPTETLQWVSPEWLTSRHTDNFPEPDSLDLLKEKPLRKRRLTTILPAALLGLLVAAYLGATLFFPLTNVPPTVTKTPVQVAAAAPAMPSWPVQGSASVGVGGMGAVTSTIESISMASITKTITVMMILEALPLNPGEQGPEYEFTRADSNEYWEYLSNDESALDVPVGGTLTEYQLLQGIMLGSAGNYTDFLAEEIWESDADYVEAAEEWMGRNGITGIRVVEPTGIDPRNTAEPASLIRLAEVALSNPVMAEIVATKSAIIPGNEEPVLNSNELINDEGVLGVKTGSLEDSFNLLVAKKVTIAGVDVMLYTAVLEQADSEARAAEARRMLQDLEATLQPTTVIAGSTAVGNISTVWGSEAELRTKDNINLILWNSATGTAEVTLDFGSEWDKGGTAGKVTVAGPLNSGESEVVLASKLEGPSIWWRLTHPLELWGLV